MRQEQHLHEKRQQQSRQVILTSVAHAAHAHDIVSPLLKPYAENRSRYHPITGTGCTGLSDDDLTEFTDEISEEFKILL